MDKYENAIEQLKSGIKKYVDTITKNIPYDRTFNAIVVGVLGGNYYNIKMNNVEYTNIKSMGGECSLNEVVKVKIPQNNYSQMYIEKYAGFIISDNLTTEKSGTALDARQGKILKELIDNLFQSVSNGKRLIATAITDKGVDTSSDDTFQTMAQNIENIQSGTMNYGVADLTRYDIVGVVGIYGISERSDI